jgi:hypothetical protein
MRDKAGFDSSTLAKNWGVGVESVNRTHLVTTQRKIRRMKKLYNTNDRHLRYRRLPVTMFTDTMYSTILSRQKKKADQIFFTDFVL